MNQWRVKRYRDSNGNLKPGWLVFGDPMYMCGKWYKSHAQALEVADKAARTVEVVLPRKALNLDTQFISWPNYEIRLIDTTAGWTAHLKTPDACESLGLTALAIHYRGWRN